MNGKLVLGGVVIFMVGVVAGLAFRPGMNQSFLGGNLNSNMAQDTQPSKNTGILVIGGVTSGGNTPGPDRDTAGSSSTMSGGTVFVFTVDGKKIASVPTDAPNNRITLPEGVYYVKLNSEPSSSGAGGIKYNVSPWRERDYAEMSKTPDASDMYTGKVFIPAGQETQLDVYIDGGMR